MVLGVGAHFFGHMPHLWSIRIFKVMPPSVDNVGIISESPCAQGYPHRSIQLVLGDLIGVDGPEWSELDDAEFEEAKFAPSSLLLSLDGWAPEEPEEVILKELIQAWNQYCPALRENVTGMARGDLMRCWFLISSN